MTRRENWTEDKWRVLFTNHCRSEKSKSAGNLIWPYRCPTLDVKWSTRYICPNVRQWTTERERQVLSDGQVCVCQALCFVDAFGWTLTLLVVVVVFFLSLKTYAHLPTHTIFSLHIHWPPYQLYEHACDYYYLKCCNRDDNCWTNKHTHSNTTRQDQSKAKQNFNKYISRTQRATSVCVCSLTTTVKIA